MTDPRLRISFANLPPRPRGLSDSVLSGVFGGCSNNFCTRDEDCCYPRRCNVIPGSIPKVGACGRSIG